MQPNYNNLDIKNINGHTATSKADASWLTDELIDIKRDFSKADLEGMEHLNYAAGIAPFLRGPYSTMYVMRPWTIRQYAGFSPPRNQMPSIAVTLPQVRRACPLHLTSQHTEAMTPTIRA